jgi:hypothetical protein
VTAPPALVGGKQLRLSWSRLRTHEECRMQGKLTAAGHKSPVADIRMFFPGTVVDRAMRQWLGFDKPEPGWMLAHVDRILDEEEVTARETGDGVVTWKSLQDKEEVRAFCRDLVTRLEELLAHICLPYEWEPAVRFKVPLEVPYLDGTLRQIILTGEIDLLVRYKPQQVVLWDLKATKNNEYWRKVLGQMGFYDICWWGLSGTFPVGTGLIQPMCDTRLLPFTFTEQSRRELFTRICDTAMDIFRDDLSPKEGTEGCDRCMVRHACPRFAVPGGHGRVTNFRQGVRAA